MITIPGVDPKMIANNLEPAFPTHPGEILKEEIEYRGISQRKLAERMGIGYSVLNEILNARRPVTEKTAMMFEAALGVEAEPLMRLQMRYNVRIAQKTNLSCSVWIISAKLPPFFSGVAIAPECRAII